MTPEMQSRLDRVRDLLTQAFNEIIEIGKLAEQAARPKWFEKQVPYKCRALNEARPITIYSSSDMDNPRPRTVNYEMTVTEVHAGMLKVYHSPPMWVRAEECRPV